MPARPRFGALGLGALAFLLGVTVRAAGADPSSAGSPDLFLEAALSSRTPFVHQTVAYRVRFGHAVPLKRWALSSNPQVDWARVWRPGGEKVGEEERAGRRYRTIERLYFLSPERAGVQAIPAPRLQGLRPGFRSPGTMERSMVAAEGPSLTLEVRSPPAAVAEAAWLPAVFVRLREQWQPEPPRLTNGGSLEWSLVVEAEGVAAEHLPPFSLPSPKGVRLYEEVARRETRVTEEGIVAVAHLRILLMHQGEGEPLSWPGMRLPWWDVAAQEAREAVLPPRRVEVQ